MSRHRSIFRITFPGFLLIISAALVQADVGGPYGEYSLAYPGSDFLTLLVVPDGSGAPLDEARLEYGQIADATITLWLKNSGWDPIPNFPREDMWLESVDDGLAICIGGTIADFDTDEFGMTQWQNPLRGGGYSQVSTIVLVNGGPIEMTSPVQLNFNSPDINGDLMVNLTDVALFAVDFFDYSGFNFRSDFFRDGQINLSDLVPLAESIGAQCP